ncbi:MAG: hypothetical protein V8S89_04240 [Oscillospiraceae bacterium]
MSAAWTRGPWPRWRLAAKRFKVYKVEHTDDRTDGAPGTRGAEGKRGLEIACGDGGLTVLVTELQAEGGKRMAAPDYFRGHPIKLHPDRERRVTAAPKMDARAGPAALIACHRQGAWSDGVLQSLLPGLGWTGETPRWPPPVLQRLQNELLLDLQLARLWSKLDRLQPVCWTSCV